MDTRDYHNKKALIQLNMKYEVEMLEYEYKQSNYDKYINDYNDLQKKIQQLYLMKQKNIVEISKMDIEIFKSNYDIK